METSLSLSIWQQINSDKSLNAEVGNDYIKVRSHLKRFACTIGLNHEQLTLLQIINEKAEPTPALIQSVEGRPKRSGTADARHRAYTGEILSRIKKITSVLIGVGKNRDASAAEAELLKKLPASVQSIVIHLPRIDGHRTFADRSKLRLTERSLEALKVLVKVALRRDVKTPGELLQTYKSELNREVYVTVNDPARWKSVTSVFTRIRKKLGMDTRRTPVSLPEEQLPPKLKLQLERYLELAPTGAYGDPELHKAANDANVTINQHEENTVANNKRMLLLIFGELLAEGHDISGMEITDLIKVDPVALPDGTIIYNEHLCPFRKRQRERTGNKVGGRDSPRFRITLQAIRAVAAYSGIFQYHEVFGETYKVRLDLKSCRNRKRDKKDAFTVEWLDYNLALLKPKFEAIIKAKTFRTNLDDLRLCLLYTWMMTLRHTAIRQQGIRNCRKGWNIYFLKRSAVRFRWREDEIKNDKDFQQTVKRSHVNTCAPLVDALNKYQDHILPFLEERAAMRGTDTRGEFFLRVDKSFKVRPFDEHQANTFSSIFKLLSQKFLDFTDVPVGMRSKFSAHHIRGLAGDYMHDDLEMGTDSTSRLLGDTRRTTEKEYLQRNRVDATPALDEAEERAAAIKERRLRELNAEGMTSKGRATPEVQVLKDALNDSIARERTMAEELAELRAKYEILSSKSERSVA